MAKVSGLKGNPAATRMANPNNKKRRQNNSAKNEAFLRSSDAVEIPGHKNKKADKQIHAGKVSRNDAANYMRDQKLQALKQQNFGFGQREVRRILNGKNQNHGLSNAQIAMLKLVK